jgi:GMP synthase (glutamine-hydrolysing)
VASPTQTPPAQPLAPTTDIAAAAIGRQMLAILDFGSQYSELIARRVRETEVYSEVLSYRTTAEQLRQLNPQGIILSGGPSSVYTEGAPVCDPAIWDLGIPVLGVCYGMQLMVQQLGGQVEPSARGEYGKAALLVDQPTGLLAEVEQASTMW